MTAANNIRLYPWFKFFQNLNFWQAVWFLYFQAAVGPAEAIMLYVVYDIATTVLEVPSGYMSDRLGRRRTLIASAVCGGLGSLALFGGGGFWAFALGQGLLGASTAFSSGTDSALLYESLAKEGRQDETDAQELRAFRVSYSSFAMSALVGGALSYLSPALPFGVTVLAFVAMLAVAWRFVEVPSVLEESLLGGLGVLKDPFKNPVLLWLFALAVLMYGFGHVPFVFGQPFILQALERLGLAAQAPLVSGAVSALMMMLAVTASLVALTLRKRLGLVAVLLLAFAMQIGLAAVMAATDHVLVIGVLLLRLVPDSLSWPFILARSQPLLHDSIRATYLSLQAFFGRMVFAATLWLVTLKTEAVDVLTHAQMSPILWGYALAGLLCVALLAALARRSGVEPRA
ncbi:MFS transporter [Lentibacter algarum]|uniref:MFS transporter n=1 Tax=Lentibacter algarum TaxID=576131 RepID=UPI001C074444|nr:MFS transporter [Lentibacter algarum]MBU2981906.1 MFS transporter [Lentibacter algarum]